MHKQIPPTAALLLSVVIVLAGGRLLEQPAEFEMPGPEDYVIAHDPVASVEPEPAGETSVVEPMPPAVPAVPPATPDASASAVLVAPAPVAPGPADALPADRFSPQESAPPPAEALAASRQVAPSTGFLAENLEREAPRDPLSQLSLALPPEPKPKNPWAGKPLFRPVATESAVFESGGNTISIEDVTSVTPEQTCIYEGESWACGVRARAAFRAWLRGRALVCQLPEGQDEAAMRGKCRLAKQDVGAWLVENGWALAAPEGPYAQAGEKAKAAGLGIFGAPPDASAIGDVPEMAPSALPALEPIMTEEGGGPQPPADPRMAFPPAPPTP